MRTPAWGVAIGTTAAVLLGGCAAADEQTGTTPSPRAEASPTAEPARLAVVDPSLIDGMSAEVQEVLDRDHLVYVAVPVIPGLEPWAESIIDELTPRIERFVAETPGADEPPYPELMVGWDLVAASSEVAGVRLHSTELGDDDTFDGRSSTIWYDIARGQERPAQDLLAPGADVELIERVREAAADDPRIDAQLLEEQLAGEREAFDALAFAPDGRLWVEFDRTAVSDAATPIALVVDERGLLSEFGQQAQRAALSPSDPGLQPRVIRPEPSMAPAPSAPITAGGDVDCSQARCAALTFDDGPVTETADLLDVLAQKGVPATFFVVGTNAQANPALLARMVSEGHAVGNHTTDHPQLTRLTSDQIRTEIDQTNDIVERATGQRPTLLRPPFGATDETVAGVARDLGMAQILWDVDPEDWKDRDSAIVTQRVLATTTDGSIVLSHDIHETTRAAYADIIDGLREQGFTLVTVPDLLDDIEPGRAYYSR